MVNLLSFVKRSRAKVVMMLVSNILWLINILKITLDMSRKSIIRKQLEEKLHRSKMDVLCNYNKVLELEMAA